MPECKVLIAESSEVNACVAANRMPPPGWTKRDPNVKAASPLQLSRREESTYHWTWLARLLLTLNDGATDIGSRHSIGLPVHVYPLYENGFRGHRAQSIEQNNDESAQLYAEFARVAEHNPYSWNYGRPALTKETIGTITDKNRMICFPCTLFPTVTQRLDQCPN